MATWEAQLRQLRQVIASNFIGALPNEPVDWILDEWNTVGHQGPLVEGRRYVACWPAWIDEEQLGAGIGAPTLTRGEIWFEHYAPLDEGMDPVMQDAGFIQESLSRQVFFGYTFYDMERRRTSRGETHYSVSQSIPFEHCDAFSAGAFTSPGGAEGSAVGARTFLLPGHAFTVGQAVRSTAGSWALAQANAAATLAHGVVSRVSGDYVTVALKGFILAKAHGLGSAGTRHWTSQATPGGTVTSAPSSGFSQYLLEVHDVDNLIVDVENPLEAVS